jgi:hypothetical protein
MTQMETTLTPTIATKDLAIKSVSISYVEKPTPKNNITVTVKNMGNSTVAQSHTAVLLLQANTSKFLFYLPTAGLQTNEQVELVGHVTPPLDPTGCVLVFVANAPYTGKPIGEATEMSSLITTLGGGSFATLNNAFAVPYPKQPAANQTYNFSNPCVK